MDSVQSAQPNNEGGKNLYSALKNLMIQRVPAYANRVFYSLGFLSMTSFLLVVLSGMVLVLFGPDWWLTTRFGLFTRSIHLWATQAFIVFILLHLLIVFLTSGYKKPRRLTWVFGALMLFLAMFEAEFGYGLRGDFSSQWRTLQASDFYNGSGLGHLINNLNYAQIYGIHIIFIPIILLALLFLHYLLVRTRGIAKPYRKDVKYEMVRANHKVLFLRGTVLAGAIVVLALVFPSPLILPTTIKDVAEQSPALTARTIISEIARTSDTATYMDNIDPYTFDTRKIYAENPYSQYIAISGGTNRMSGFLAESVSAQNADMQSATEYFSSGGSLSFDPSEKNPVISIASDLTKMAQSGLYSAALESQEGENGLNGTYVDRFLSDTGLLEAKAQNLGITTDQYGMLHEENGFLPGAWWLAPLGVLDHTILASDPNQDRDGAEILGILILLLVAFPYIPGLNRIPEKLGVEKFFWKQRP